MYQRLLNSLFVPSHYLTRVYPSLVCSQHRHQRNCNYRNFYLNLCAIVAIDSVMYMIITYKNIVMTKNFCFFFLNSSSPSSSFIQPFREVMAPPIYSLNENIKNDYLVVRCMEQSKSNEIVNLLTNWIFKCYVFTITVAIC